MAYRREMRRLRTLTVWLFYSLAAGAQVRTVAITVDDLPYVWGSGRKADLAIAENVNRRLLDAFQSHRVPVTGFVIQTHVESFGLKPGAGLLQEWLRRGFDLGNHTYSHSDINDLTPQQIEHEIVAGETTIAPLIREAGKKLTFFRFPMNHTGDTKEKHDAVAEFLRQRGYQLATCTIDNEDYLFNDAYLKMLEKKDTAAARKLRQDYLAYTSTEIDYYAHLHAQVFGHEIPQVMLLHDNRLNADVIDRILKLFEEKKYRFVPLATAQADPAYQTPETYITTSGMMWGYRWAKERNIKVNGSLETEPPKWILGYGKPPSR